MLKINKLSAQAEGKQVLEQVNLEIGAGEVHVLLGPNGSGKTSLAQVILGNPHYQVESGQILFKNQDITSLSMEERARLGLALSYQHPPEIRGVNLNQLLTVISKQKSSPLNDRAKRRSNSAQRDSGYQQVLAEFDHKLLTRDLNVKFSGGEKKIVEIIQILALEPELVIFDELDSGLDLKNLDKIAAVIKSEIIEQDIPTLFITHHGQIINSLKPDWTHVMLDKSIICNSQNYQQVISTIRKHGYQKCRHCQSVDS